MRGRMLQAVREMRCDMTRGTFRFCGLHVVRCEVVVFVDKLARLRRKEAGCCIIYIYIFTTCGKFEI